MRVICPRHTWVNIHIHAISHIMRLDLFLFVWLICGEIQEKCQRFRTTLCLVDWWRMQRGLEAKAWTCVCFLSSQISWSGGVGYLGIFSAKGFCLYGRRTLLSLISPQQLNTKSSITRGPERQELCSQIAHFRTLQRSTLTVRRANSDIGSVVPNCTLPFRAYQKWQQLLIVIFYCCFNGKLQTDSRTF